MASITRRLFSILTHFITEWCRWETAVWVWREPCLGLGEGQRGAKCRWTGSGQLDCWGQHRLQETRWEQLIRLSISRTWLQTWAFSAIWRLSFFELHKTDNSLKHTARKNRQHDADIMNLGSSHESVQKKIQSMCLISHCLLLVPNDAFAVVTFNLQTLRQLFWRQVWMEITHARPDSQIKSLAKWN